jgi:ABC-type multidrug transport system fused ATPase/permease subunit
MEGSIIVGGLLLSATQFLKNDAITAITTLSIFLVAGTRVSPALLRLQQSYIQFKAFVGEVQTTLILINRIENSKEYKLEEETINLQQMTNEQDFDIEVRKLSFCYKNETQNAIYNVDFRLKFGKMLAIIGPSGSGKSTLVDLMLGALIPNTGEVRINGYLPRDFLKIHPGGLGFVAQESIFLDSSVRDNLLIGLETNSFPDSRLWEILEKVGLGRESKIFGFGLDTNLGNRGLKLSVGQRQRLSIARALLTRPKVLFLDEPTSSLDFESENLILNLIETLRNETSIVVIAHRLETIKNADLLLYLQNGSVKKFGTFEEVSSSTLDFL